MAEDARTSPAGDKGRRTAADGGGVARDRAREHVFARGLHQSKARATARPTKAARAAQTRQRRRAPRRRNSGEPSTAAQCAGTTTSGTVGFLTSLRDSGWLHDDDEATTAGNGGGGAS
jgi:hypothetical protein